MTKHTPGPWKMSGANTVHGPDCIIAFVGTCDEEVRKFSSERQNADAHLIAAAPELLAALRTAEAALADIGDADREPGDDVEWCERRADEALPLVRAAIAKARGSQ